MPSADPFGRHGFGMAGAGARELPACVRVLAGLSALLIAAACLAPAARGQTSGAPDKPSTIIGGEAPKPPADGPCVTVDIGGYRAGHLDCASRRLEDAARVAQAQARAAIDTPVVDATSPDVRTGVASQTATRQRMGNTFGTSVYPQRPNRPPPVPRPGGRP